VKVAVWIGIMFALLIGMNASFFIYAMSNPDPVVHAEGYAR
jgi:hypothetical protein